MGGLRRTPLTADHENMHFFDSGLHEERDAYFRVDMFLKDGNYDFADGAEPRQLFEVNSFMSEVEY